MTPKVKTITEKNLPDFARRWPGGPMDDERPFLLINPGGRIEPNAFSHTNGWFSVSIREGSINLTKGKHDSGAVKTPGLFVGWKYIYLDELEPLLGDR